MSHRAQMLSTIMAMMVALGVLAGCGGPAATLVPTGAPTGNASLSTATVAIPAPEIGITETGTWFNSQPLTLAGLRGKPVFLVFWSDI